MPKSWRRGSTQNHAVTKSNAISRRLLAEYGALGTWKAVAAEYELSAALVYRVAVNGYEPRSARIRSALGLPAMGLAEICPVHNKVCAVKHRAARTTPAKPRMQWKRLSMVFAGLLATSNRRNAL